MIRTTRRAALAAFLALATLALATPDAQSQDRRRNEKKRQQVFIPGGGTELFRALLARAGVQPVTALDLHRMGWATEELIVIVIGEPRLQAGNFDSLEWARRAITANGAALVASDSGAMLFDSFSQRVGSLDGSLISANPRDCYRGDPDCPIVTPISPTEIRNGPRNPGRVWDVFRGLTRVATNQPTYLELTRFQREYQYPLAQLPRSSRVKKRAFAAPPLLAVGGDGPNRFDGAPGYSFLAVADSSIFVNQMLMETETDNLELAIRTVEYLQGPGNFRKRCAFFENGELIEDFDTLRQALANEKPKIPPQNVPNLGGLIQRNQDKLVELADQMADQVQTNDALHKSFLGKEGSHDEQRAFGRWAETMSVLLAIGATLVLLRRLTGARHPSNLPPPPRISTGVASTGPPGVFDRREKELARRNNLYEPVRNLLREFFESVGAPAHPGPRLPRLVIDRRTVRKPESLRQALQDMWRLAYGPPLHVTAQRWFELEPYFERLRQAHADDKWRFATDDDT